MKCLQLATRLTEKKCPHCGTFHCSVQQQAEDEAEMKQRYLLERWLGA